MLERFYHYEVPCLQAVAAACNTHVPLNLNISRNLYARSQGASDLNEPALRAPSLPLLLPFMSANALLQDLPIFPNQLASFARLKFSTPSTHKIPGFPRTQSEEVNKAALFSNYIQRAHMYNTTRIMGALKNGASPDERGRETVKIGETAKNKKRTDTVPSSPCTEQGVTHQRPSQP